MATTMRTFVLTAALALATTVTAGAQTRPRFFVNLDGGIQTSGSAVTDRLEFEVHAETATFDIDYPSDPLTWFGASAGVRLWKQFGAGVAFSIAQRDGSAAIDGQVPHPFFFDTPRAVSGEATDLTVSETALHMQVLYIVPTRGRFRVILSAGPSRIEAERELVTRVNYDEEYPFDTATFRNAETRTLKASKVGFNVGADLAFMFTRAIGVGGMVRFSRADLDIAHLDGRRVAVEAGGLQAGGGLRIAF